MNIDVMQFIQSIKAPQPVENISHGDAARDVYRTKKNLAVKTDSGDVDVEGTKKNKAKNMSFSNFMEMLLSHEKKVQDLALKNTAEIEITAVDTPIEASEIDDLKDSDLYSFLTPETLDFGEDDIDASLQRVDTIISEILALIDLSKTDAYVSQPITVEPKGVDGDSLKISQETYDFLRVVANLIEQIKDGNTEFSKEDLKALESLGMTQQDFQDFNTLLISDLNPQDITDLQKFISDLIAKAEAALPAEITKQPKAETALPAEITKQSKSEQASSGLLLDIHQKKDSAPRTSASAEPSNVTTEVVQQRAGSAQERHFSQARYDARYDASSVKGEASVAAPEQSDDVKVLEFKKAEVSNDNLAVKFSKTVIQSLTGDGAALSSLQPSSANALTTGLAVGQQAPSVQAAAANTIAHAQSAAYPHQATQMIAATIQKAVKAGDDTNIKLQLDPPELGRVEVKMSIGKDSATKIVLTVEKPETLFLLQKDAQVLDRALQNAGLDTQQGSLSFELASDGHSFDKNGGGESSGKSYGRHDLSEAEEQITETTMTWRVDPETGAMRYSLLV